MTFPKRRGGEQRIPDVLKLLIETLSSALGKKMIVTEEEIDAVTHKVAKVGLEGNRQGSVRRLTTRGSK